MPLTGAISAAGKNKILFYSTSYGGSTFVVPSGITSVNVVAVGAAGGSNSTAYQGFGAFVVAKLAVTPGETIWSYVGQVGQLGGINNIAQGLGSVQTIRSGSYPNGGASGPGDGAGNVGWGGGGMTGLFRTAAYTSSGTPLIIAGGGGGAGTNPGGGGYGGNSGQVGSNGGEVLLSASPTHNTKDGSKPGGGATQSAGGALGHQSTWYYSGIVQPIAGTQYAGGNSGYLSLNAIGGYNRSSGGGGGGGYYGGGGGGGDCEYGPGSGGGGGSSFIIAGATNTSYATSNFNKDGAMLVWVD